MKYVFKKIKAVKSVADTERVTALDKKSGIVFAGSSIAQVNYVFQKPGEGAVTKHSIALVIDDQFFDADDLYDFISFLQAAQQRLEKLDAKDPAK